MEHLKKLIKNEDDAIQLDTLFEELEHPNPNINKKACLAMARLWPEEAMERLMVNLESKNIETRRKSVKALGEFGENALIALGIKFIHSDDKITKVSCLKALVKIVSKQKIDGIPNALSEVIRIAIIDDTPEMVLTIVQLLRQIGKEAVPLLVGLCSDENILRASAAVTALSEIEDPIVKSTFLGLLEEDRLDEFVREGILQVLSMSEGHRCD